VSVANRRGKWGGVEAAAQKPTFLPHLCRAEPHAASSKRGEVEIKKERQEPREAGRQTRTAWRMELGR
jgi:hypothetical protein